MSTPCLLSPSVRISVMVVPEACGDEVVGWSDGALEVQVVARPDGPADCAVETLLAEVLGVAASKVHVVLGHGGTRKLVQIDGFDDHEIDERLPGRTLTRFASEAGPGGCYI